MVFVNDMFFLLAGVSMSIGLLSLLVGWYIKYSRIHIYFGIFSIGAGLYYLIFNIVDPASNLVLLNNRLLISAAALYYLCFPWFIAEFTGYRKKAWPMILSFLIFAGYILFLFTTDPGNSLPWHVIIHIGSIGIGIFGLLQGLKYIRISRIPGLLFSAFMVIFLLLLADEILATYADFKLISKFGDAFLPMDLYPVLFIIIMSGALWQELTQKYQLQDQLAEGEKKMVCADG